MTRLWDALVRIVHGDDIFVSYARRDGLTYAAALATKLTERKFATRVDQWGTVPGERVPNKVLRALRRSSMLVVLSTKESGNSQGIGDELRAFVNTGRLIVPIEVDGNIQEATWWSVISGLPVTRDVVEDEGGSEKKNAGIVSETVLNRIEKTFIYRKKDHRLRQLTSAMLAIFLVLLGASGVAAWYTIEAQAQAAEAVRVRDEAERARTVAEEERKTAIGEREEAIQQQRVAEKAQRTAEGLRDEAVAQRMDAEKARQIAQTAEQRSELMQSARVALSSGNPTTALIAAQSAYRISDTPGVRLLLADIRRTGVRREIGGFDRVEKVALSPTDPSTIAAIGTTETPGETRLLLWNMHDDSFRSAGGAEFQAIAFGADGDRIFAAGMTRDKAGSGVGMRQQFVREFAVIEFDLTLRERRRVVLPRVVTKSIDKRDAEWEVRGTVDIRLNDGSPHLLVAGFASATYMGAVSNATPHHYRAWIALADFRVSAVVDHERELSSFFSYRGRAVPLGDGEHLVVNGIAEIFLINMRTQERTLIGSHATGVSDLAVSPSGNMIVAVGNDTRVTLLERHASQWTKRVRDIGGEGGVDLVRFINEGHIALARQDLTMTIVTLMPTSRERDSLLDFDVAWKAPMQKAFAGHNGRITDLAVSPDGRWIATASDDRTVRLWSAGADRRRVLQGSLRGVASVAFSRDSRTVVAGSADGRVRAYDVLADGEMLLAAEPNEQSPEPRISDDDWRQGGGLTLALLREHWGFVNQMTVDRQGDVSAELYGGHRTRWRATGQLVAREQADESSPDRPRLWVLVSEDLRVTVRHDNYDDKAAAQGVFTPDRSRFLFFSYKNRSVYILDVSNRAAPIRLQNVYGTFVLGRIFDPVSHEYVRFSPDGRYAAFPMTADASYALAITELGTGDTKMLSAPLIAGVFAFSSQGLLAAGMRTGEILLHSPATNQSRVIGGHAGPVRAVAFDSTGRWLASAADDRLARLWSVDTGEHIDFPTLNPIDDVTFSPNGRQLLVASGRAVHSWYVPSGGLPSALLTAPRADANAGERRTGPVTSAFAFLIHRPGDRDFSSVVRASLLASTSRSETRLAELIRVVHDSSKRPGVRVRAAYELVPYGTQVFPYITTLAAIIAQRDGDATSDDDVREAVEEVVRNLPGDPERLLAGELTTNSDTTQQRALLITMLLLFEKAPEVRDRAAQLLSERDATIRITAARILASATDPPDSRALAVLERAMVEEGDGRAAAALGSLGAAGLPVLVRAMGSRESDIARPAIAAQGAAAVNPLLEMLAKQSYADREDTLRALSAVGAHAESAVPTLIAMLRDRPADANDIISTLQAIGPAAAAAVPDVITSLVQRPRDASVHGMGMYRFGPAIVAPIRAALPTAPPEIASHFAYALGQLGPQAADAVPEIIGLLKGMRSFDRYRVVEALGKIGPRASEAGPLLLSLLTTSESLTQREVVDALAAIRLPAATFVPAAVTLFEAERKRPAPERYLVTPSVLQDLETDGVPVDVRLALERLHDGIDRERDVFASILSRFLPEQSWNTYGDRIIARSRVAQHRRCDELSAITGAIELLATYGTEARTAGPALTQLRQQRSMCGDIVAAIDAALPQIGRE